MSESNGQPLDPVELVSLPADDHRRREHSRHLAGATDHERQAWETELALTDRLRTGLPQVQIPAGLEGRLLAIPDQQPGDPQPVVSQEPPAGATAWRRLMQVRMDWRHVAAVLVIAGMMAAYLMWPRELPPPVRLDQSVQNAIVESTIRHRAQAAAPGAALEIASADPQAVEKALAAHGFDFPVMMLKPSEGELVGGGTCKLGTANAVYTQWHAGGATYTLYEFNGRDLGAPPEFLPAIAMPRQLWTADAHYVVHLWPGPEGKCCWALVTDKEDAKNLFAQSVYGTNP